MASDLYKLIKNFLSLATGQVIVRVLNVVATLYAVRMLGPSDYGVLSSGLAFALVLSVTANMGLADYLILRIARSPEDAGTLLGDILPAKVAFFPIALIGFILITLTNPQYAALYALLVCYGIAHSYFLLICATFRGLEEMEYQTLLMFGQTLLVVVGSVGAIWLTHEPMFVALSYLVASAAGAAGGYWLLLKRRIRPHYHWAPKQWGSLILDGLPFGLIFIYGMAQDRLPSIFLPFLASEEAAGWYNAVYNIIVILTTIPAIVMGTFFPFLARKSHDKEGTPTANITTLLIKYTNVISVGLAAMLYVTAPPFVLALFDEAYRPSIDILKIMAIGVPALFLGGVLISILSAIGQQRTCARYSGYTLLCSALLSWLVIRQWGQQSAAWVYVFNNMLLTGIFIGVALKEMKNIRLEIAFVRPVLAAGMMIAILWIGRTWPIVISASLSLIVYGIGLIITRTIGKFEVNIAYNFLGTLGERLKNAPRKLTQQKPR